MTEVPGKHMYVHWDLSTGFHMGVDHAKPYSKLDRATINCKISGSIREESFRVRDQDDRPQNWRFSDKLFVTDNKFSWGTCIHVPIFAIELSSFGYQLMPNKIVKVLNSCFYRRFRILTFNVSVPKISQGRVQMSPQTPLFSLVLPMISLKNWPAFDYIQVLCETLFINSWQIVRSFWVRRLEHMYSVNELTWFPRDWSILCVKVILFSGIWGKWDPEFGNRLGARLSGVVPIEPILGQDI